MSPTWSAERPIRVVLVDDQGLFRQAIATLVDAQADMSIVGQAANGEEGVSIVLAAEPDVVLLDLEMPGMDGIEAAREIIAHRPATKVVMLTVNDDDDSFLAAIRTGAHGYLLKDLHPHELFEQIRSAVSGQSPIAPKLLPRLLEQLRQGPASEAAPTAPRHDLSERELEILQSAAEGLTNREIGRRFYITEGTVKNHMHNCLRKLGLENRTQAADFLTTQGLRYPGPTD
ncbi:MAG: response regulator transcription factor [Propionibacteriaceae bacterium]|nr:response regulator transcription factor [Propionibacteriaceae bacterium]